ncbi:HET-domain-containing protein [Stipitochalara longipes BDJ]|nr:HET-domain-containing protein [Stipitochalara longipes BDJ]
MEQYVHRPLCHDNEIRILRLDPAISFGAPLCCSLTDARLSDRISYAALSYVWGAATGDRRLICDGAELLITSNCELALRHLRLTKRSRNLWVDSVCIDQKSTFDRNHQVKQMGEIYKMAANVFIWLGISNDQTKPAFARWREFEQSSTPSEEISSQDRLYLREICNLPWFRRVWTIQEMALATKCLILCGCETISWEALVLAAKNGHERMEGSVRTLPARFRTLATRVSSRAFYNNPDLAKASSRIWLILTKCRREEASDPRDKIFGLFAILESLGLTIPAPDYAKTPATVYEELTVTYIQQFKHLGLLELAFTFGRHPAVPTWVPDFNDRKFFIGVDTARKLPNILVDSALLIDRSPGQLPLRGKRLPEIEFCLRKSNLTFETLFKFRRSHDDGDYQYHLLLPWASILREWIILVNQANCPTGRDATHLFSWLTARDGLETIADAGTYVPVCGRVIENFVDSEKKRISRNELDKPRGFKGLPDTPDGIVLYLLRDIIRHNEMGWAAGCLDSVCEHTLVLLSSGHIGRTPYYIEDEDIVVWFAGAHRPMVVRPVGKNYIIIGSAHIHGIKEGDVWEDKEDVTQLEIFILE